MAESRARRRIREAVESRGYRLVSLEWEPWSNDAAEAAARGDIDSVASGIYDRAKQRAKRRAEAVQALRTKENP